MGLDALLVALCFATFLALLLTGFPVAFSLAGTALLFALLGEGLQAAGLDVDAGLATLSLVVERLYGTLSGPNLVALPLFVFMGHMLDRSGIATDLLRALQGLMGRMGGGLAVAVTLLGVILAASTGIIGASVALLGTLALPAMLEDGYRPELATGTIAAAGCLGILIPPSIMLVLMSEPMQLSVGDLFLGALLPGLLLAGLYLAYLLVYCRLRPEAAPPHRGSGGPPPDAAALLRALAAPLGLILAVLGSIFAGVVTPSEAAGIGAAGALWLARLHGRLDLRTLAAVSRATSRTSAFIFAIFLGASAFSVVLRELGGDRVVEAGVAALPFGATGVVLCVLALVFVLGFLMDWIEITLIVLPLVEPLARKLGIDRLWLTVAVAVCLQTSFLTPPVGFALFYLKGVAPDSIRIAHLYRGIVPFVLLQLVGLLALLAWPGLATWLPREAFR